MINVSPLHFQVALDIWRQFIVDDLCAEPNTQDLSTAYLQEASTSSQNQLSANTRNSRKSMSENMQDDAKDAGPLWKAYQTELAH